MAADNATKKDETNKDASKKSGLNVLKANDILFNDGDKATSLYILQKGNLRLFKPKGKGFVEIAVLRAGEVIGEMAYFADNDHDSHRSCSAQALGPVEVIEISFLAFEKTLQNLNPWFKTIIQNLANRLRKTNSRLKELENNSLSMSHGKNSKVSSYQYFKLTDLVRYLAGIFLVAKAHGKLNQTDGSYQVNKGTILYYLDETFALSEAKLEDFLNLMQELSLVIINKGETEDKKNYTFNDVKGIYSMLLFLNKERVLAEEKQISVGPAGQTILAGIISQVENKKLDKSSPKINLTEIINEASLQGKKVSKDDATELVKDHFISNIVVEDGGVIACTADFQKIRELFPIVRLKNLIKKFNDSKNQGQ